jgi:hypothetical protein
MGAVAAYYSADLDGERHGGDGDGDGGDDAALKIDKRLGLAIEPMAPGMSLDTIWRVI